MTDSGFVVTPPPLRRVVGGMRRVVTTRLEVEGRAMVSSLTAASIETHLHAVQDEEVARSKLQAVP